MSKIKFVNVSVEIDDPQERFKENEEITVHQTYDSQENMFRVSVPEQKKVVSNEPKKQPTRYFTGMDTGITGTITVKGNAKVNMDMPPAKIKRLGMEAVKADLNAAFEAVMEKI